MSTEYKSVTEQWPCRLCFHYGRVMLMLTPTPLANSFPAAPDVGARTWPLELQECLACGHVQLRHKVPIPWGPSYRYQTPEAMRGHYAEEARRIMERYPEAKSVYEIGSNNGIGTEELRRVGFQATGIDPCSKTDLARTFSCELADSLPPVDLIVANNVLAHVDDLHDVFRGIDHLLPEHGALIFEVQYLPTMMACGTFDMIYHEHRDYHTLRPLVSFLRRFRLVIAKYECLPTHGGSVRVYCERPGVTAQLPDEPLDWRMFAKRIERAKRQLRRELEAVGKPVVAFGAAAKACTLIHHFGIAEQIAWCADDTPEKQGRYIPGTAIPIFPTSRLESEPPGPMLLLAWNYANEIQAQYPHRPLIVPFMEHAYDHSH